MADLSHVDDSRRVRMVDVGGKPVQRRRAVARALVRMAPETVARLGDLPKGDALTTAQLAGIMAAKRTSELIPLCHPLAFRTSASTARRRRGRRDHRVGRDCRADRRRDGGAHCGIGGGAHGLRHGEGDRQADDLRGRAGREDQAVKAAVLTVSDRVSRGEAADASGDALAELLAADGYDVARRVVPDEADEIAAAIEELAGERALVLTTGGTGIAPRDVTPEATRTVLEREAPGIAEALRANSIAKTPHGLLSRGAPASRSHARRQPARVDRRLPRRLRRPAARARPRAVASPRRADRDTEQT